MILLCGCRTVQENDQNNCNYKRTNRFYLYFLLINYWKIFVAIDSTPAYPRTYNHSGVSCR
jgi:hypothetical protein